MSDHSLITNCRFGFAVKELLKSEHFLDITRRTKELGCNNVGIPVKTNNSTNLDELHQEISNILKRDTSLLNITWEIKEIKLPLSKKKLLENKRGLLKEKLQGLVVRNGEQWTTVLEADVPKTWEKHGDMVLVSHTCFRSPVWKKFAPECWEVVANHIGGKRLAVKETITSDGYRTPQVTLLLGESGWVEHVDNGVRYTYDITQCMFSAGNITEKMRVAGFDCHGETVLDLYAGIGYFTLPYLVHAKADFVHACEWNPHSVEALQISLQLNKVSDRCQVHIGDNRKFQLTDFADRVNLGLIPSSEEGWPIACRALRSSAGGILHIHGNVESQGTKAEGMENSNQEHSSQEGSMGDKSVETEVGGCETEVVGCETEGVATELLHNSETSELFLSNRPEKESDIDSQGLRFSNNIKDHVDYEGQSEFFSVDRGLRPEWERWAFDVASRINDMLQLIHPLSEWTTKILHVEHVKSYAPHVDHLVLDLECRPIKR